MLTPIPLGQRARTKTVATIGPACDTPEMLAELIARGVDVFRLNMAHGNRERHEEMLDSVRRAVAMTRRPVATLADLAGPKIRLGQLRIDPLICAPGEQLVFRRGESPEMDDELVTSYPKLLDELRVGDSVMLTDGTVRLEVIERSEDLARCRVIDGGEIRSRQGVNLPGVKLTVPAMDDVDRDNAVWAGTHGIDFISLSFVRTAEEIESLKSLLREHRSKAHVIAKIEKREAMENLDSIVRSADGVMVARGDLGVEIDIAQTALAQKQIIRVSREYGKPVIVATQMLDSMHRSLRPTRAEVSDVSNAILDGADACMLSGETAIGQYPRESVRMMQRIMVETEKVLRGRPSRTDSLRGNHDIASGVVYGASQIAKQINAGMMVLATGSSEVLLAKSKQRDFVPAICVTESATTQRRACLYWGIYPILAEKVDDADSVRRIVCNWAETDDSIAAGSLIVIVADHAVVGAGLDSIIVDRLPEKTKGSPG